MQKLILVLCGWLCAHTPEVLLEGVSRLFGFLVFRFYGSRRRMMLANLAACFPDRDARWARHTAQLSCERLVETGLLSLASPFFPLARIRRMASLEPGFRALAEAHKRDPFPVFLGSAHMACWEGLTWAPSLIEGKILELVAVYRPLRQPALDDWVRRSRERFGVRLLSRRAGLHAALHTLKRNGGVSILIDQNAGSNGVLTPFFGRDCSTTPLPGMLVEKTGAQVYLLHTRRTAFWRFTIECRRVSHDGSAESVTLNLNRELEDALRGDEDLCASWLWLHQRWKILFQPAELARLRSKRGAIGAHPPRGDRNQGA